jgi:hypothetical protein
MQQLRLHATRQGRAPAVQKYVEELEKGTWDEVNYDAIGTPFIFTREYSILTPCCSRPGGSAENNGRQGSQWNRKHASTYREQNRRSSCAAESDIYQVDPA